MGCLCGKQSGSEQNKTPHKQEHAPQPQSQHVIPNHANRVDRVESPDQIQLLENTRALFENLVMLEKEISIINGRLNTLIQPESVSREDNLNSEGENNASGNDNSRDEHNQSDDGGSHSNSASNKNASSDIEQNNNRELDPIEMFVLFLAGIQQRVIKRKGHHESITCDSCKESGFKGPRYKCLTCRDFDLCGLCFEKRRKAKDHVSSHAMLLIEEPSDQKFEALVQAGIKVVNKVTVEHGVVHNSIKCDGCGEISFRGLRFKCDDCLDLNLCFNCYSKKEEPSSHKSSHAMVCWISERIYSIKPSEIELGDAIGQGCFGKIFKAQYKNETVACKVVDVNLLEIIGFTGSGVSSNLKNSIMSLKNEMKIYRELVSPSIIRYIGECEKVSVNTEKLGLNFQMMILLEFMNLGTLDDLIHKKKEKLSLRRKFNLCLNLISGIRRIHSKGITHKDLKPDNIFIDDDLDLKIGDMGLAYSEHSKYMENMQQLVYYPRVYDRVQIPDDIYSFGFIMNEIFTGTKHKMIPKPVLEKKSEFYIHIIASCLRNNRDERPSAEKIEDYLLKFDSLFWTFIRNESIRYVKSMSQDEKDQVFRDVYPIILSQLNF